MHRVAAISRPRRHIEGRVVSSNRGHPIVPEEGRQLGAADARLRERLKAGTADGSVGQLLTFLSVELQVLCQDAKSAGYRPD